MSELCNREVKSFPTWKNLHHGVQGQWLFNMKCCSFLINFMRKKKGRVCYNVSEYRY